MNNETRENEMIETIAEINAEMYGVYTDEASTARRRLFEVGIEIARAACDFDQDAHENTRIYGDVMRTLVDLDSADFDGDENGIITGTEAFEKFKRWLEGMRPSEYQKLAMRTCSIPYEDKQDMLIHATTGLASEAGEFAGLLQKVYQGHEYDRAHALKELGDCLWMIAEACTALDATLEEVMQMNIAKLRERYPEGFDPERSLHRREGDV